MIVRPASTVNQQEVQVACVHIPAFPLQLSTRELPNDFSSPIAVVDRDNAQSHILLVDSHAKKRGIQPGLRYSTAVALCPDLHAVVIHPQKIESAQQQVLSLLGRFSPGIEPAMELPGTFYLDGRGMRRFAPDMNIWGHRIQQALYAKERLHTHIAIGFTRFGVFTVSRIRKGITVFKDVWAEQEGALNTPLKYLEISQGTLKELEKLGICTIRNLLRLPEWELRTRFNEELFELVRRSKTKEHMVYGIELEQPFLAQADLEYVLEDNEQILSMIQELCNPLLKQLADRQQGVKEIHLGLKMDVGGSCSEKLQPAEPTLHLPTLAELLRLRLNTLDLKWGIIGITVPLLPDALPNPQRDLSRNFAKTVQNLAAADQALARIRAEFGAERVLRAKCVPSHLPNESISWEFFDHMRNPAPGILKPSLVRKILDQPRRISTPRRSRLNKVLGPYTTSGFWWRESRIVRNDYFVETENGTIQWIFYDCVGKQWYEQGEVQ